MLHGECTPESRLWQHGLVTYNLHITWSNYLQVHSRQNFISRIQSLVSKWIIFTVKFTPPISNTNVKVSFLYIVLVTVFRRDIFFISQFPWRSEMPALKKKNLSWAPILTSLQYTLVNNVTSITRWQSNSATVLKPSVCRITVVYCWRKESSSQSCELTNSSVL